MLPRRPSFYRLYKQGRFRGHALTGADRYEAIEQKERFAVAILAFVLQYDEEFQKTFVQRICNEDAKGAKSIESRLRKKFPNSKSLRIDSGTVPEITQEDDSLTDQDWFDSVFESMFPRPQQT